MRGGQAFKTTSGNSTNPTYDATITGNKLYINLRDGVKTTASYQKDKYLYSFGGEVAGGAASAGTIRDNHVYIKGSITDDAKPDSAGVLETGLIVGGAYNVPDKTFRVDLVMSGNIVAIDGAWIKKAEGAQGTGIFGGYIFLGSSNPKVDKITDGTGNRVEIRNSVIDTSSVGGLYVGNVPNPGDKGSLVSKQNKVVIEGSTINLKNTHFSADFGFFGGQDEGDKGLSSENSVSVKDSTLNVTLDDKAFIIYGVRYGTASEKNEVSFEKVNLNLNPSNETAKGVMAIFGARSRKTSNDNKISIVDSTFTGPAKRFGLMVAATVDSYIYSFSEKDKLKQPTPEGASRNVIQITGSTIPVGGLIAARFQDDEKAKVDPSGLRFEENRIEIENTKLGADNIFVVRNGMPKLFKGTAENNHLVIGKGVTEVDGSMLKLKNLWVASGEEPLSNFKGNTFDMGSRIETTSIGGAQHLGFHVDQKMLEEKAPLLKVTGDLPVRFGRDGDFKSTVTLTGADATVEEGTNLVLIESKAGFQNEKNQYWNAGDDLDAHKKDHVVRSRRSVGREDTSSIKAEDYKLKFEKSSAEGEHALDLVAAFPKAEPARERPDPDPVQPPVEPDPQPAKPKPIDWTPVKPVRSGAVADTDALMRSSAASFATMAVTSDLFVDTVLRSDDARRNGIFAAARAGTNGFDVKPRLSADVYAGLVGIGGTLGETDLGGFIEMGRTNYRTKSVEAKGLGKHNFAGVGLFAVHQLPVEGLKLTGYVKTGQLENKFETALAGKTHDFEKSAVYWGAHLGVNYDWRATAKLTGRAYVSYFWDGREGENHFVAGTNGMKGTTFSYDALSALRVEVGNLFTYDYSPNLKPYFGISVEQTFGAKAQASLKDEYGKLVLRSSDLDGTTGVISAGWQYRAPDRSFEFRLGVNGYAGLKNGMNAMPQAVWHY